MPRRESGAFTFAMNPNRFANTLYIVLFQFRNVVRTSYTNSIPKFSQLRPKTCENTSRACHINNCRLHQAKFAAARMASDTFSLPHY